mmetsp:Transcript_5305/g.4900  ORF Transcript_5305/g.4900 Transcript_5305/m.4900 type:complete len:97 (+) Transcript_5305:232-522(+)
MHVDLGNLANGKFSSNKDVVQWLFDYTQKVQPNFSSCYNGYEKRVEAYKRQTGQVQVSSTTIQMSQHLIPNKTSYRKKETTLYTEEEEPMSSQAMN